MSATSVVPAVDGNLARDDERPSVVTVFYDFQNIARLFGAERFRPPIVEDQEFRARYRAQHPAVTAIAMRDRKIGQQPGHAIIEHIDVLPAGLVAERAGKPALAEARRANDMLPKNSSLRLSSSILIIHLPGSGSWPFDALRTVGWIILW